MEGALPELELVDIVAEPIGDALEQRKQEHSALVGDGQLCHSQERGVLRCSCAALLGQQPSARCDCGAQWPNSAPSLVAVAVGSRMDGFFASRSWQARMWVLQYVFDLKLRAFGAKRALQQERRKAPEDQVFLRALDAERCEQGRLRRDKPTACRLLSYFDGTMPAFSKRVSSVAPCFFLDAALRGASQVMICNNPVSGVVSLVGLAVSSPWLCICSMVGLVCATLFAWSLGLNRTAFANGLYGYNGMLVGGAMSVLLAGGAWNALALALIVPGSCLSVLMALAMGTGFGSAFGVPPFTLPFIAMTMILSGALSHSTYFRPIDPLLPTLGGAVPLIGETTAGSFFAAWMSGCGQIYIAHSPYSGLLMVLAMAIYSRVAAVAMMVGSLIGLGCAYSLGAPTVQINLGLWGYNPALLMIAMWTFYLPSIKSTVLGVAGSVLSSFMVGYLSTVLRPLGLPQLTLAFSATAFLLMLIQSSLPGAYPIALRAITWPENHLRQVRPVRTVLAARRPAQTK